eukprot:1779054-Lingulodinium_polyedra.AAC.1
MRRWTPAAAPKACPATRTSSSAASPRLRAVSLTRSRAALEPRAASQEQKPRAAGSALWRGTGRSMQQIARGPRG